MRTGATGEEERAPEADWRHAPAGYACPMCAIARGDANGVVGPADVVYRDVRASAFVSPRWWPNNRGHVIVIPNAHAENLYEIAPEDHHHVVDTVQLVARAMRRTYGCDGISTRQHNEPAGNQDVWHFHMHVFPRWQDDGFYQTRSLPGWAPADERQSYADRLRAAIVAS